MSNPICLQCGESREAVKREGLFCGTVSGYEYQEADEQWPQHRWRSWRDDELARMGVKAEAYERHRRTSVTNMRWIACEDTIRGHVPATEDLLDMASYVGECISCGRDTRAPVEAGAT